MQRDVPTQPNIAITEEKFWNSIRRKRNWSGPGIDRTTNYWLKKMSITHRGISIAITEIINNEIPLPSWLLEGRTVLIPKKVNPRPVEHRSITCLNVLYKAISGVIKDLLPIDLLQIDQRGGRRGTMGCNDNLLIDKAVLEDARLHSKNLSMVWVDVKKAFDSIHHDWIIKTLTIHNTHPKLISMVKNIIQNWKITLEVTTRQGKEQIGPIKVNRGIIQGDDLVLSFTLYQLILLDGSYDR